ncbi:MAG: HisA/HisF-related TIM barrel protein [Gammaproteobacteria bacterium]|nr:HisA/HisF-related TIM barrel protein [Gammaproteobacteria bacterium]
MNGEVVHARGGDRSRYKPLRSPIAVSSDPVDVVHGLRNVADFRTIYVADLDAIRGTGHQLRQLADVHACFPEIALWIDAGITDRRSLENFFKFDIGTPVLGSETLRDPTLLATRNHADPILSLDYDADRYLGALDLAREVRAWPPRIISMSLDRVGSARGPDTERVSELLALKPDAQIYAAGGVYETDHLLRLASVGAQGALVGSAIYAGHLSPQVLAGYRTHREGPA